MILSFQNTTIGRIGVAECEGAITNLFFPADTLPEDAEIGETELTGEAFRQLNAYLQGSLCHFSLPLAPSGTPFMERVWRELSALAYGTTSTYRAVAIAAGNARAVRAVGMANHRNPLPVFIPCHRVIGSNGSLSGYRGGVALKKLLIELERETKRLKL
ncbi:methylated-DNA--[protein]-cysteine S-methyltransferase [Chlorobium ferrooxidans]|uniref:Methylated-DNA--protein-cysteine methyltransferase n=1 Tax=Chlorobium ferrooxidans DSM 13031 TaxID=377431 RepID=Q0YR90_9CHLB|nr:methylated-DNA--[protein]-cysteine S-methyltransferase [Chlorobium ferrooxidans]EAT58819.1 methylated-DNA--protein-cysteine methyltransferase [Chlorobium ferrooxidans DSM 13031]